jgi:ATP-binding cassette subfamily B protein/subfamily B ATP-binding cassette protein MsbA
MRVLRFLVVHIRRYRGVLVGTCLSMLALVAAELVGPWIIRDMIGIVEGGLTAGSLPAVGRLALLALGVLLARTVLQFFRSYLAHVAGWGVVADVRARIYEHLQRLSLSFYQDRQTGQLMSRMVNDSDKLENLIAHAIPDLAVNVLSLLAVGILLFGINARLMLLALLPIPIIVLAMRGFARFVQPAFALRQKELGELNAALSDNLLGMREIQAFTREETEARRIGDRIEQYRRSLLRALRLMATFHPFSAFAASLGTVVLIYAGGRMAVGGTLPVRDLVAFFLYLNIFYGPIQVLSTAWENIQEAIAGADRVAELLEEAPEIADRPHATPLATRLGGTIELRDVDFSYSRGDPVLESVCLSVAARSTVALVGPTGVGKTTLVSLVPRFYDVTGGALLVDDRDVRGITLRSLRSQISIVSQDVFLFHGSVRDNILFGRESATSAEVEEAARVANAEDFILRLPEGYDTFIGERGVKLSGGQKQRLAIARAVLKDAPILILDEATSAVDTHTELLIQQALETLTRDRTAIIIAHRLSTVRRADLIVVLDGTGIAEMGSHASLMARDGLYRHLNEVQSRLDPREDLERWELDPTDTPASEPTSAT